MLLGAVGCQKCGCKPCQACEAACDDTPDSNFQTVYQANDTDGVLSWSGDAMGPIDGPFTGFEGSGPFSQTIGMAEDFSVVLPGTRFPCYARLSVWKNISGGTGSETVTSSITITCTSGRIRVGMFELSGGESLFIGPASYTSTATYRIDNDDPIPSVAGDMDQSLSPPFGWFSAEAVCSPATLSFTASISWSNADIQHSLYGRFIECYDDLPPGDPGDCLDCAGIPTPAPDTVYLTISNFDGGGAVDANGTTINYDGTYAFDLTPSVTECARYLGDMAIFPINQPNLGGSLGPAAGFQVIAPSGASFAVQANKTAGDGGGYMYFAVFHQFAAGAFNEMACGGDPVTGSVSGEWKTIGQGASGYDISFDWEISS
jgi:hypothetical protein